MSRFRKVTSSLLLVFTLATALAVVGPARRADAALDLPSWCIPGMPCSFRAAAGGIVDKGAQFISSEIAKGVLAVLNVFWNKITTASSVRRTLHNGGLLQAYESQMGVALILLVPLVLAATLQFLLAGAPGSILRLYVVSVPLAIGGGFIAIFFVDSVMLVMDHLANVASPHFADNLALAIKSISESALLLAPVGLIVFFIAGGIMIVSVLALFIELVARDVMLATTLLFVPLAFAGVVWPVTSPWLKKSARIILSLGFVKFVMVALLSVGILVLNGQLLDTSLASVDRSRLPFDHIQSKLLEPCRNDAIAPNSGTADPGQEVCVKQLIAAGKGMSAPTKDPADGPTLSDEILAACRVQLGGITSASEANLSTTEKNLAKDHYYQCIDRETDLYSDLPDIKAMIADSGILDDHLGFDSITNIISGIAIFLLAALSPAIAFKLFDIFEGGIEQVRYARNNTTPSVIGGAQRVTASVSVVDLLTRNKGSSFLND